MKDKLLDEIAYVSGRLGVPGSQNEGNMSRVSYRQIAKRHGIDGKGQVAAGLILKIIIVLQGAPGITGAELRRLLGCANVLVKPSVEAAIHLGAVEVSTRSTKGRPSFVYRALVDDAGLNSIARLLREAAA